MFLIALSLSSEIKKQNVPFFFAKSLSGKIRRWRLGKLFDDYMRMFKETI